KVTVNRKKAPFHSEGQGKSGITVAMDNAEKGVSQGASPMELLLMGVAGCSAIDIVMILDKQRQEITDFRLEVEGIRKEYKQAKPFEAMHVNIFLEGTITPEKAKRAAALSFEKYCSVSLTLQPNVAITYDITLNNELIE
uniref:OsmC family protein n=1 Tax=Candidatus Ulvibacter alkanivorans TaxID=2267620 RepID=UPI00109D55B2